MSDGGRPILKIAYLNPVATIGGAEMCLLDVIEAARKAWPFWKGTVVLGEDGPLRAAVERLDVPCAVLPLPSGLAGLGDAGLGAGSRRSSGLVALATKAAVASTATLSYISKLRRLLRAEAPDLIQTNGMKMHVLGAWAASRRSPTVWHLHDFVGARPVMAGLLRASTRPGLSAVSVSRSAAADARRTLGPKVPVTAIHNTIDVERFSPGPGDGAALDGAAGLSAAPSGTVRVGLIATFARWKGHDVFIEAASRITKARSVRYYVVGGPIYRSAGSQFSLDELRGLAERFNLGDRLGFVGHWNDPVSAFRALDVVVHASTRPEPFGRVIVEGMACGKAVIAMREGGAAELFEDGTSAIGSAPNDPEALASAISTLVEDETLRDRLGQQGRRTAVENFNRDRLAELWAPVYRSAFPRFPS